MTNQRITPVVAFFEQEEDPANVAEMLKEARYHWLQSMAHNGQVFSKQDSEALYILELLEDTLRGSKVKQ